MKSNNNIESKQFNKSLNRYKYLSGSEAELVSINEPICKNADQLARCLKNITDYTSSFNSSSSESHSEDYSSEVEYKVV